MDLSNLALHKVLFRGSEESDGINEDDHKNIEDVKSIITRIISNTQDLLEKTEKSFLSINPIDEHGYLLGTFQLKDEQIDLLKSFDLAVSELNNIPTGSDNLVAEQSTKCHTWISMEFPHNDEFIDPKSLDENGKFVIPPFANCTWCDSNNRIIYLSWHSSFSHYNKIKAKSTKILLNIAVKGSQFPINPLEIIDLTQTEHAIVVVIPALDEHDAIINIKIMLFSCK